MLLVRSRRRFDRTVQFDPAVANETNSLGQVSE